MKKFEFDNPYRKPLTKDTNIILHFRNYNPDGTINPKGGETVVYCPKRRLFGHAICQEVDTYNKNVGMRLALNQIDLMGERCYSFQQLQQQDYVTMEDVKLLSRIINEMK